MDEPPTTWTFCPAFAEVTSLPSTLVTKVPSVFWIFFISKVALEVGFTVATMVTGMLGMVKLIFSRFAVLVKLS